MERPPGMKAILKQPEVLIAIIILFHVVGYVGFALPALSDLFEDIVPFHLLLMLGILIFSHDKVDNRFWSFYLIIYFAGYLVEWVGVHTASLFGYYAYGSTLGVKVLNIPLMIGVNWFLLVYSTGVLMQRSGLKNRLLRMVYGALLMMVLDILIEPVAIKFNYWHWRFEHIPVYNYVCWFFVSLFMLYVFESFRFKRQSWVGPALLITQLIFFAALNIYPL
ncbi:carotenoid biosynthesis protein [Mucilaginibacter sp. JRF]|uniref:carotenoid biosynthesis protein n=1 Tax=Mucilaginibacter sp. JRF TaxID=2780088 RepID=UPI00187F9A2E|nr:carotenoid biosynthesis protein [Mucilaginibacter sp. JRF]MBE9585727.1 carotenoid biosynthesis protein [Mucilaginibacter sp. JRF]